MIGHNHRKHRGGRTGAAIALAVVLAAGGTAHAVKCYCNGLLTTACSHAGVPLPAGGCVGAPPSTPCKVQDSTDFVTQVVPYDGAGWSSFVSDGARLCCRYYTGVCVAGACTKDDTGIHESCMSNSAPNPTSPQCGQCPSPLQ
jgi:hypothetical protein